MKLALPTGTAAIEGDTVKVDPGAVALFQLEPFLVALIGRELGVLVHNVLEFIHHAAIRQEEQAVLGVHKLVLGGVGAKEQMMPGACQKFHAHAVNFGTLHTGAA